MKKVFAVVGAICIAVIVLVMWWRADNEEQLRQQQARLLKRASDVTESNYSSLCNQLEHCTGKFIVWTGVVQENANSGAEEFKVKTFNGNAEITTNLPLQTSLHAGDQVVFHGFIHELNLFSPDKIDTGYVRSIVTAQQSSPKTSAYLEAGQNVIGPYRTFGNIRLKATAEDIDCKPNDDLECHGKTAAGGEWEAKMYRDQTDTYRVAQFSYKISIPDSMAYNDIVHLWEEKLGSGRADTNPSLSNLLYFNGNNDAGATANTQRDGAGYVGVNVFSTAAENLHYRQRAQLQKARDQQEIQDTEQKYKSD